MNWTDRTTKDSRRPPWISAILKQNHWTAWLSNCNTSNHSGCYFPAAKSRVLVHLILKTDLVSSTWTDLKLAKAFMDRKLFFFGVSKRQLKTELQNLEAKEMDSLSRKAAGQTQTKKFINYSPNNNKKLLDLRKFRLKNPTGLLRWAKLIKSCVFCELETETSQHILSECKAL